jgi:2',3'-cyclic-nucleotide 2'-phosphodiesterase (5'-nucleotidase family)
LTNPKAVGEWHPLPVLATARKCAAELREKSDLIVLLCHITGEEERAILQNAPEIPILVSGHIHSGLPQAVTRDGRILVRVKGYGEEIGKLTLQVDTAKKAPLAGWKWTRITVDSKDAAPAEDVAREVNRWEAEVTARVDQPLAVAKRAFTKAEVKALVEQAMREASGADFAFMNLGGVRDTLPAGQLLERHIWDIMPFDNLLVEGTFKGRDLPRVVVGNRKVDPNREYTLVVTDFTAANQATAENLRTTGLAFPKEVGVVRDILIDWFRAKKTIE